MSEICRFRVRWPAFPAARHRSLRSPREAFGRSSIAGSETTERRVEGCGDRPGPRESAPTVFPRSCSRGPNAWALAGVVCAVYPRRGRASGGIVRKISAVVVLASVVASAVAQAGSFGGSATAPVPLVRAVIAKNAASCEVRVTRISSRRAGAGWLVTAVVAGKVRGNSVWQVAGRRVIAVNPLARKIRAGCPQRTPTPTPTPPPPVVSPPASYEFGASVPGSTRELVQRSLGYAGGYFRARLGLDLPPLSVYAFSDHADVIAAWSRVFGVSIETARRVWSSVSFFQGRASTGPSIWLYAPRVSGRGDESRFTAMVVHEAFHVLQHTLAGGRYPDSTQSPPWLHEGTPEYLSRVVVAEYGLSAELFRDLWITDSRKSGPLRAFETWASFDPPSPIDYSLSGLAVDRLIASRGVTALVAYHRALGQGVSWPDAFRTAFGITPDAFYEEFEAYRRSL